MTETPPAEMAQLVKYVTEYIRDITALSGQAVAIEFQTTGRTAGLVVKANAGQYKQKVYVNGSTGEFVGQFSFMVLSTVAASDGEVATLNATKPLQDIADDFDGLTKTEIEALEIGDSREASKIEMTTQPQDMAGIQENGDITFFAVYTLTYRRKGA